ncbi:MAG: protein-glutamate O-methyltransferase CheR [Oscillospiraceae bacterium]|jgi:chemotaxis protein methyltransferase CheR|nr:protein-glutamate O-methyltransferase CheR [Oscillospiraceae bacterium]
MNPENGLHDEDFKLLYTYMKDRFGIDLEKKRALVEGRLSNSVAQSPFNNYHDFIADALDDRTGTKVDSLIIRLTTNYTYFMREETHYRFMRTTALPEWTKKIKNYDLRVWSAGCSSGEEAYTIAMTLDDYFGFNKPQWDCSVLATDISQSVLEKAKNGIYPSEHLAQINPAWRKKYFVPCGGDNWQIRDELRREVIFRTFNLMGDFGIFRRKFHIIFCRNVMIYFDKPTKAELAGKFFNALEPGGYLFIGMSETLSGIYDRFEQVQPSIYRKRV